MQHITIFSPAFRYIVIPILVATHGRKRREFKAIIEIFIIKAGLVAPADIIMLISIRS